MPQIVPVSDFRADIRTVSQYTDEGEIVVLTQNGRPKWAMVDYNEWNAINQANERALARSILASEEKEERGELRILTPAELKDRRAARKAARQHGDTL